MEKSKIKKPFKKTGPVLAVVADKFEAEQIVDLAKKENVVVFCLGLEAELYLKMVLGSYENPIYNLVDKSSSVTVYQYTQPNFNIAYEFLNNDYYRFLRDRYAYFLTELDRSLDIANETIKRFKPSKILIGKLVYYKGSSVIEGNLKKDAFFLLAKYYKIHYRFLKAQKERRAPVQIVGKIIHFVRSLKRQSIPKKCDLLIVATPRHVIHMAPLIKQISKTISVAVITYNLSLELKRQLDRLGIMYSEKERLLDNKIKKTSKNKMAQLLEQRLWNGFIFPKYSTITQVTDFVRDKLKQILSNETEEIIQDYLCAQQVMAKTSPKMLLTTTDPDTKVLTYINTAKKAGIKTLSIQHGIFFPIDAPSSTPQSKYFVTWSKLSLASLKKNPHFKNKIILIGQSPFHHIPERLEDKKEQKKVKRILFLATIDLIDSTVKTYFLAKLFHALDEHGDNFEILIRIHPFQDRRNLESLAKNGKIKVVFDKNVSLNDSIAVSDLAIFENTTAGLDTMLAGLPSIYFNPYSGQDFFGVSDTNAAIAILSEKDINEKLNFFLNNSSRWTDYSKRGEIFARKYLGLDAGSNRNKLAEIILREVGYR